MSNLRTLRRRIRSIRNIHDITKAMEMISAVRFKRVEGRFRKSVPYIENLEALITRLLTPELVASHPLFEKREVKTELLVLVTGDRGLCGSFNTNLLKKLQQYLNKHADREISIFSIGKVGTGFMKRRGKLLFGELSNQGHKFTRESSKEITESLIKSFSERKYDSIKILYMHLERLGVMKPQIQPFLSLDYLFEKKEETQGEFDYIFEPNQQATLNTLVDLFIRQKFFNTLLNSITAEYNARMIAMKMATDNSKELIGDLTLERNKVRQAMITNEISEIIGGVNAMN